MVGTDAYVQVQQVTTIAGHVIVQNVQISREGLATVMLEDQIIHLQQKMARRRREIAALEQQQHEDQRAMNQFIAAVEELRNSRPY